MQHFNRFIIGCGLLLLLFILSPVVNADSNIQPSANVSITPSSETMSQVDRLFNQAQYNSLEQYDITIPFDISGSGEENEFGSSQP